MDKVKGSGIVTLKKIVQEKHPDIEQKLIERLTPEAVKVWQSTTLAISWIEVDLAGKGSILFEAAQLLFPGNSSKAMMDLGQLMAKEGLPFFYKIFIRVPTPQFVFKRVAALWNSFYQKGKASVEDWEDRKATFVLKDYPGYTLPMREYMQGYLIGTCELLGLKNIKADKDDKDPGAWKWHLTWEK